MESCGPPRLCLPGRSRSTYAGSQVDTNRIVVVHVLPVITVVGLEQFMHGNVRCREYDETLAQTKDMGAPRMCHAHISSRIRAYRGFVTVVVFAPVIKELRVIAETLRLLDGACLGGEWPMFLRGDVVRIAEPVTATMHSRSSRGSTSMHQKRTRRCAQNAGHVPVVHGGACDNVDEPLFSIMLSGPRSRGAGAGRRLLRCTLRPLWGRPGLYHHTSHITQRHDCPCVVRNTAPHHCGRFVFSRHTRTCCAPTLSARTPSSSFPSSAAERLADVLERSDWATPEMVRNPLSKSYFMSALLPPSSSTSRRVCALCRVM